MFIRAAILVALASVCCLPAQETRPARYADVDGARVRIDDAGAVFEIELFRADGEPSEKHPDKLFVWRVYPTFAAAHADLIDEHLAFQTPSVFELDAVSSELDDAVIAAFELAMDRGVPGVLVGRRE